MHPIDAAARALYRLQRRRQVRRIRRQLPPRLQAHAIKALAYWADLPRPARQLLLNEAAAVVNVWRKACPIV